MTGRTSHRQHLGACHNKLEVSQRVVSTRVAASAVIHVSDIVCSDKTRLLRTAVINYIATLDYGITKCVLKRTESLP